MTRDGEALLRAVLEDPADDLPRLAYADWLEENGHSPRAEFIRCQVEAHRLGHDPDACRQKSCPCQGLARRAKHLLRTLGNDLLSLGNGKTPQCRYRFGRGFMYHIDLSPGSLIRNGRALFSAHPIVSVKLSNRMVLRRDRMAWWLQGTSETPAVQEFTSLPSAVFTLLAPVVQRADEDGVPMAGYEDPKKALADLSRACVAWGRRLVGLPSLQ